MRQINDIIRKNREVSLLFVDSFSICLSYVVAFALRLIDSGLNSFFEYNLHFISLIQFLPIVLAINWLFLFIFKINKSLWKYTSLDEVARIVLSSIIANAIWFYLVLTIPIFPYIRSIPIIATLFQMLSMLGIRFIYRWYRNKVLARRKNKNALIIGAGNAGNILLRDLLTNDNYDCRVIGFIDDSVSKVGKRIAGIEILGTTNDIASIVSKKKIEYIYIAIPSAAKSRISEIVKLCSPLNVKVYIMDFTFKTEVNETILRDVSVEDLLGRDEVVLDNGLMSDFLANKVVLVTGAGGSIGSELCRQILRYNPSKLILVDVYENNMYTLQQDILMQQRRKIINEKIETICLLGSIRDRKRISEIIKYYHPNIIFHAAEHKHVPLVEDSPLEAIKNNIFGTKNVLDICVKYEIEKFILISTDKAVNPTNVMGATKRICELLVQAYKDSENTIVGAVRFGNVLGSNGSVIPLFKEQISVGGPVTVTDPEITRYFMTIPEAARLVLQAGSYASHGDIFVLDMGQPVKILTLAESMISLSGLRPYEDIEIEFVGLRPGEKMYEELSLGNEHRYRTANNLIYVNESMDVPKEILNKHLAVLEDYVMKNDKDSAVKWLMKMIDFYK